MLALPIFPGSRPPSIVGAGELNFCVGAQPLCAAKADEAERAGCAAIGERGRCAVTDESAEYRKPDKLPPVNAYKIG